MTCWAPAGRSRSISRRLRGGCCADGRDRETPSRAPRRRCAAQRQCVAVAARTVAAVRGAVALALLDFATLALSGRPWGVTSAFALWGAKLFALAGNDVAGWPYWSSHTNATALASSVTRDVTNVMDAGNVRGAMAAAALAGCQAPVWRVPMRPPRRRRRGRPDARLRRPAGLRLEGGARISVRTCQAACMAGGGTSPRLPQRNRHPPASPFGLEVEQIRQTGC